MITIMKYVSFILFLDTSSVDIRRPPGSQQSTAVVNLILKADDIPSGGGPTRTWSLRIAEPSADCMPQLKNNTRNNSFEGFSSSSNPNEEVGKSVIQKSSLALDSFSAMSSAGLVAVVDGFDVSHQMAELVKIEDEDVDSDDAQEINNNAKVGVALASKRGTCAEDMDSGRERSGTYLETEDAQPEKVDEDSVGLPTFDILVSATEVSFIEIIHRKRRRRGKTV